MEGNGLTKLLNYQTRTGTDQADTGWRMEEIFGTEYEKNHANQATEIDQIISDVTKVFELARWPAIPAKKVFSAPVNDEQDLLFIRTKLNQALEGADYSKPREMYLPEAANRRLKTQWGSPEDPAPLFTGGIDSNFIRSSSRYMFNHKKVYYHALYSANGVTIWSRKRIGKIQPMTDIISKSRASQNQVGSLNDLNTAGTIGVIGGGFALIALGYAVSRNRSR